MAKETYSLTTCDEYGFQILDLPRLCDIFRRAGKDAFDQPALAEVFNTSATAIGEVLHDYQTKGVLDRGVGDMVRRMVLVATANDMDGVILPVNRTTAGGQYLRDRVLFGESLGRHHGIFIDFQEKPYVAAPDVDKLGPPQNERKSVFDFGLF